MSWLECINETFKTYAPTLDAADKLIGIAISAGLFWLAHRANGIAKSNLELAKQEKQSRKYRIDKDEREIFRAVYRNLSDALALVLRDGRVDHEALALFWQARDQARLELPVDIQEYSENLRVAANKAFAINELYLYPKNGESLPVGEERSKKVDEHESHLSILLDAKPHEHFAKYMRVEAE